MTALDSRYLPGGPKERFACGRCYAVTEGAPPHGYGEPCPQQIAVDEAYREMLDAQRMSYAVDEAYREMLDAQRMSYIRTGTAGEGDS